MSNQEMSIGDLAQLAGVTRRTIRYYLQRGLLAPPAGAGKNRVYSEDHLLKLRLIRRLQEAHYPLEEIRLKLADLSREEIKEILAEEARSESLSEEIRRRLSDVDYYMAIADTPIFASEGVEKMQETWIRMEISHGVELHYRVPVNHRVQEAIDRIKTLGREMIWEALDVED